MNQLYAYVYPLLFELPSYPALHSHPLRSSQSPELSSLCLQQLPTGYLFYTWKRIYFNAPLSIHPTLAFPLCVYKSLLYICVSTPALQLGSLYCFSRFRIYVWIYNICFSLSYFILYNRLQVLPLKSKSLFLRKKKKKPKHLRSWTWCHLRHSAFIGLGSGWEDRQGITSRCSALCIQN